MNFRKIALFGTVVSSAFLLSACYQAKSSTTSKPAGETEQTQAQETTQIPEGTVKITLSDSGFTPVQTTVKSGDKLAWVNNSSKKIQIGSDPHPTHTVNGELSNGQFVLEIAPGASATVTLTKTGNWGYHDHLNPGIRGKVTVQ